MRSGSSVPTVASDCAHPHAGERIAVGDHLVLSPASEPEGCELHVQVHGRLGDKLLVHSVHDFYGGPYGCLKLLISRGTAFEIEELEVWSVRPRPG